MRSTAKLRFVDCLQGMRLLLFAFTCQLYSVVVFRSSAFSLAKHCEWMQSGDERGRRRDSIAVAFGEPLAAHQATDRVSKL